MISKVAGLSTCIGTGARAAVLVAALVITGVSAACGGASTDATPEPAATGTPTAPPVAPSPTPEPTLTPSSTLTPPATDPEDILDAALAATNALDSFHFDMEAVISIVSEDASIELPIELSGDYKAPDMLQSTLSMSLGPLTIETEVVDIGDVVYVKDQEAGVWIVEESAGAVLFDPSDFIDPESMNPRGITLAGTETLDGVEYYVVEAVADDPLGSGGELDIAFWVEVDGGPIARVRAEGEANLGEGGPFSDIGIPSAVGMVLTMRLSDYNEDVTIEAPVQPITAPTPQPAAESAGEPLTDHTSLVQFAEAMAAVESAHVEGELTLKESADAKTGLLLQRFSGGGVLGGDNEITGTLEVNAGGFAGSLPFETRRVDGVDYGKDPATGQWVVTPPGDPSIINDLFDPSIIGASDLVDPVVTRETQDGAGVLRVEGSVESDPSITRKVLWMGDDDHLLRQIQLEAVLPASGFPGLSPGGGDIHMSLTARYSRYDEPVDVTASKLAADSPDIDLDCKPYLDISVSSGGDVGLPTATSYRCLDTHLDPVGQSPDAERTFTASANAPVEVRFAADEAPTTVKLRLYPMPGVSGRSLTWPEGLPGGPQPVESLAVGGALSVSHTFVYGPGDYTLVVRATWDEHVDVFYALNLQLE